MFVSRFSPEQWAEARRLRAAGTSFSALAANLGISATYLRHRARKEEWPGPGGAAPAGNKPRLPSPATADVRRELAHRLYGLIAMEIEMKELHMRKQLEATRAALETGAPPPVFIPQGQSYAALIEQINQVTEMASEPAAAADGRRTRRTINPELTALSADIEPAALAAASEKDAFRREIADKLEKLVPPA